MLLSLSCGSTRRSVIVVSLSYDATVTNPETITNLQVTVDGLARNYPVPASASFQKCTAATPCSLEIDTQRTGRLEIKIAGTGAASDGGAQLVIGIGSGSATADVNKVQTVVIQLSCASGGCGLVAGSDGGATDGGVGGSSSANGGKGGSSEGKAGASGVAGGPGRGGATGSGGAGTGGIAGTGGTAGAPVVGTGGIVGTGGTAGAPVVGTGGMIGTGGTAGAAANGMPGTGGRGGTSGATGGGGRGVVTGSGGMAGGGGKGGATGTGGAAGKGGAAGTGGSGGAVGANCADSIKMNGYSWPGVPACSACLDNGISQEGKCASIISCVDQNYPCTGDCLTNCHNQSGGNLVVFACANALLTAACN